MHIIWLGNTSSMKPDQCNFIINRLVTYRSSITTGRGRRLCQTAAINTRRARSRHRHCWRGLAWTSIRGWRDRLGRQDDAVGDVAATECRARDRRCAGDSLSVAVAGTVSIFVAADKQRGCSWGKRLRFPAVGCRERCCSRISAKMMISEECD